MRLRIENYSLGLRNDDPLPPASLHRSATASPMRPATRADWAVILALIVSVAAAYWPVRHAGFINFDDPGYVSSNPIVQRGLTWPGVVWAFTTGAEANWHPLTWLSHMIDCSLFGLDPTGPHVENVALHALNAALLFWLLRRATASRWPSALVAALFALHPAHVESVAWIAERKDLLSSFFWLVSSLAYIRWVEVRRASLYAALVALLALGLMCKPMLVTLPFALILFDIWPLRRIDTRKASNRSASIRHLIEEKLPLFGVVIVSCVLTMAVQRQGGAMSSLAQVSFASRIANATVSYARYVGELLWPSRLSIYYPRVAAWPPVWLLSSAAMLSILSITAWTLRKSRPYFLVGWLFFLGTLVPVIGLVQVGSQSIADRYTYIPSIGAFVIVAWALGDIAPKIPHGRIVATALCLASLLGLAIATRRHARVWLNNETLFRHALAVSTVFNEHAHYQVGVEALDRGEFAEAQRHFEASLRFDPNNKNGNRGMATALARQGLLDRAVTHYEAVLRADPGDVDCHRGLGVIFADWGRDDEAAVHFKAVLRDASSDQVAHARLGRILAQRGDIEGASEHLREALRLQPNDAAARLALIKVLLQQRRQRDAIEQATVLRQVANDRRPMLLKVGAEFASLGLLEDASEAYARALAIDATDPGTRAALGLVLMSRGQRAEAERHFEEVLRTAPGDSRLLMIVGEQLAIDGFASQAASLFAAAISSDPATLPRVQNAVRDCQRRGRHDVAAALVHDLADRANRWSGEGKQTQAAAVLRGTDILATELGIERGAEK